MNIESNKAYIERLKKVECRDATYTRSPYPVVLDRAKGAYVWDAEGTQYIDLINGFGALPFGHNPDFIVESIEAAWREDKPIAMQGLGDLYPSTYKVKLLEELQSIMPPYLPRGFLALTGSQAVELAVKTALLATKKNKFVVFSGSYHGLELGILPLTSRKDFREPFLGWIREENILRLPFGAKKEELRSLLLPVCKDIGCMLVEPIQGRAGFIDPPQHWLKELSELCKELSILLVFDEVFTGLGRSGVLTHATDEVECDLVCFGKTLGGGMPVSACFGREEVMRAWPESTGEALHTGTFFGHNLSCFVSYLTVSALKERKIAQHSESLGMELKSFLQEKLLYPKSSVRAIRGRGLMLAIEFKQAGKGVSLAQELQKKGILVLPAGNSGESLSLVPPLDVSKDFIMPILKKIIQTIES